MKKRKYTKPMLKEVTIELNELCAGSECNKINVIVPRGGKMDRTKVFIDGDLVNSEDQVFWDDSF